MGVRSEVGATQIDAGGMRPELEADAGLTLTAGACLVLAEARNEEYSRISPAAGLALLGRGSGTRRVGGSSFPRPPHAAIGSCPEPRANESLSPGRPGWPDTKTSRDLALEKSSALWPTLC